jgi:hypothetical protein
MRVNLWIRPNFENNGDDNLVKIRRAKNSEYDNLTRISFESKGIWNYPQEY